MSLIDGLLAMLGAIESDALAVREERCISVRNRNASCLRCVEACTSGAIAYRDNQLKVEPDRCIGCGTCATACPTCAIEIRNPTDDELTSLIKGSIVATKGHPVIACEAALVAFEAQAAATAQKTRKPFGAHGCEEPAYDAACVVALPCLGRVDESALVGIAAYKAFDATLVCGDCASCAHAPGGALVRQVVDSACSMLEAFGSSMPVDLVDQVPERVRCVQGGVSRDAGGVSRRDFLRTAKDGSARAAGAVVQQEVAAVLGEDAKPVPVAYRKVNKDGTLSHFVPTRRLRLCNYLKHIGEPVADQVETRVIGAVSIDAEKCSACRMCAVFCPTGAIVKMDESDAFGVIHRPSACMQCRLCERICPEQAIKVSGLVPIRQFMGKEAVCYAMERPSWTPNRPASMYDKVHSMIGEDLEMCMF